MASKKDKHLESAQKFLVKGQLDRAIKDYEQAVALDPKDIRVRQKLAELLVRANRREEALREYEVIGKYYADNGFYLKSIAVYKQIQKIDPANLGISLTLASLNEKQGLIGNALSEYKTVFDHYEKSGALTDAISILERMQAADKENVNIRLKLAETRFKAGHVEEAYDDFSALAMDLKSRGDDVAFGPVCERIGTLFPERKEFLLGVAEGQMKAGNPAAALPLLNKIIDDDRFNPRALYLMAEAARASGDGKTATGALNRIVQRFPDELPAREGLISATLEGGNVEQCLKLLLFHGEVLLARAPELLEGFYLTLQRLAPEDPRVAEGIGKVRAATGKAPEPVAEAAGEPSTVTPSEEIPPVPEEEALPEEVQTEEEVSWEEEIDISFGEDDGITDRGEEFPAEAQAEAPGLFAEEGGLSAAAEEEFPTEEPQESFVSSDDDGLLVDLSSPDQLTERLSELAGGEETEEVELEITDFGMYDEDWLNAPEEGGGAGGISFEESGESLSLDFTPEELDEIMPLPQEEGVKRDKYGLDGLFSAFKKGVDQQLEQGDTETHYNLGIAYKEMGLYDDAIAEFKMASIDPRRLVDSITLQGVCYRDKGEFARAEEALQSGLGLEGLSEEERLCLVYELALLYETSGDAEHALAKYREINSTNPHFRDTVHKIARLQCEDEALDLDDIDLVDSDE